MTDSISTGQLSTAERNKKALTYGLMLGLIHIVVSTGVNMMVSGFIIYNVLKVAAYAVYMIILGVFAAQIRKANGGYIELREVFGASFIMLAVAWLLVFAYNYVYMFYIDPDFMMKIRNSTVAFYESKNIPDDKLDEIVAKFDKEIEGSRKFSIAGVVGGYFGWLILDCLFGLIVSLIVKKPRPVFEPM